MTNKLRQHHRTGASLDTSGTSEHLIEIDTSRATDDLITDIKQTLMVKRRERGSMERITRTRVRVDIGPGSLHQAN